MGNDRFHSADAPASHRADVSLDHRGPGCSDAGAHPLTAHYVSRLSASDQKREMAMPAERFDFPNNKGHNLALLLDRPDGRSARWLCSRIALPAARATK